MTGIDVSPRKGKQTKIIQFTGTVQDNISVPPNGGCVVSVRFKIDSDQDVLTFPGFHQVLCYGDYKREVQDFCQLFNFESQVV